MEIKKCSLDDCPKLAQFNKQLIEDEGHDNPMNTDELQKRMADFISGEYQAVYFIENNLTVGYALVKMTASPYYLRQFFICREFRRRGLGRLAFNKLLEYLCVDTIDIEVLSWNKIGIEFWKSLGFQNRSNYMHYEKKTKKAMAENKTSRHIYLDSAATTRPSDEVVDFLSDVMINSYANPDSMHSLGLEAEKRVEHARNIIASSVSAKSEEIIFTSSGTEANNLAVFGAAEALKRRGNKIITTDSEHPSVYMPMLELEKRGFEVIWLSTKGGKINMDEFKRTLDIYKEKVILISVMFVNNETGSIYDISEIIRIVESTGVSPYIHCDAVQAFGKIPIDLNKLKIDMMSVSAHKIHGIKGAGALFMRKGRRIIPQILGGGQENSLRSSTLNTPGIFAFGKAAQEAVKNLGKNKEYIDSLYDYAISKIREKCPNVIFNQYENIDNTSKYILSLRLPNVRSEVMLNYLSSIGIYISSGSACSEKRKNSRESKRVLLNYGLDKNSADFTVRVSFSKYNNFADIDGFVSSLSDGINKFAVY